MLKIVLLLTTLYMSEMRIDFTNKEEVKKWRVINDGVMGGKSEGFLNPTNNGVFFYGTVSLENNGGFTSFQTEYSSYDLSAFEEVEIRYRSTGIQIALQINHHHRYYKPKHKVILPNTDEWSTITIPLADFQQYQMGKPTGKTLDRKVLDEIVRIGFITQEKKAGKFRFEVSEVLFR